MKKLFFYFVLITLVSVSISLNSCQQPVPQKTTTTVTTEKVTYSEGGFYVEQQIVVKGNTVWGISKRVYGTGMQWREIVALNPFLNTPNRLYYNPNSKMWIVRIYRGEALNIGGQMVYPSCTYESSKTETITEPVDSAVVPNLPLLSWFVIFVLALFAIWCMLRLFGYNPLNSSSSSSSSAAVHVDIHNGCNFDNATRATLLGREQDFRDNALKLIQSASDKDTLSKFGLCLDQDSLYLSAEYKDSKEKEKDQKPPKKEK